MRDIWVHGEPIDAKDLCRPYGGELTIERTPELWVHR